MSIGPTAGSKLYIGTTETVASPDDYIEIGEITDLGTFGRTYQEIIAQAIGSRGDRLIVRAVSNAYPSPTTKEIHQSEKPEPMLRHFFQMFVDENTRMLDPTCGSGTALRAAESLGAKHTIGLEINKEFVERSRAALRKARTLRSFERKGNG